MSRPRLQVAGLLVLIVAVAGGAGIGGYAVTDELRSEPASPTPAAAPSPYVAAGSPPTAAATTGPATGSPPATPAAVARTLTPLLSAAGLGTRVRGEVLDVATGRVLLRRDASTAAAPASTAKVLTAAAVLSARAPGYRIRTTVRAGANGAVVLVGGGDPTLTGAAAGHTGAYREAARVSDLAAQLRRASVTPSQIVVDDSLFAGPTVSPRWAPEDVPSDYASPITATLVDGGRNRPTDFVRSSAPDLAAGKRLAALLGRPGIPVVRGRAPVGAPVLATVASPSIATLVEQMMHTSDNVIAECLARQVALAEKRPADFVGAAAAVRTVLTRLGIDPGAGMVDGSGLAAGDRVSAATLAGVLRLAAGPSSPGVRNLIAALPVAAWSGTLASRYVTGSARAGAGLVRAKTGTLTGVSALAGTVHDRSGELLAFAFIADRAADRTAAEPALDAIAARLAGCGCG
jgi:D-alanyl-D-alanine carboxypeptidase/D-alanyl-D-alanine-endopeptidase (penicillin-binding protein 4)